MKYPTVICMVLGVAFRPSISLSQTLAGLSLDDNLTKIALVSPGEMQMKSKGRFTEVKKEFTDAFSLTVVTSTENGKILFINTNWLGNAVADNTGVGELRYGKTSLNDIQSQVGMNHLGYSGNNSRTLVSWAYLSVLSCYQLKMDQEKVLCFGTSINKADATEQLGKGKTSTTEEKNSKFYLTDLILANKSYLDNVWGPGIETGPSYKYIEWPK